jgi:glutamate/tyrosine decarboxylase-like PLP-dependent enzyme
MANLAALCMARAAKLPEAGRRGMRHFPEAVLYASKEVHLSIGKACDMLGLGREALRLLPTDADFRLRSDALVEAIERDRREGRLPIAVVASAGTASTGAVDPLEEIAGICQANEVWLHIDGAYGALAATARPDLFRGLAQADSVSLDCHKWLFTPIDASCLLYKNPLPAFHAFSYDADYATPLQSGDEGFAFFDVGPELSRPFRALKVWMMLSAFGAGAFREVIDRNLALARLLGERLAALPDFEVMAPISLSICCFRYRPSAGMAAAELDKLNRRILLQTQERGRVYMSNTAIDGRFALRVCVTNHRTTESDWDILIDEVRAAAK